MREVGIEGGSWNKLLGGERLENGKINRRGGLEQILFDTLKWNTKKLKCFELQNDQQNTSSLPVRSSNTFSKNINKHYVTSAK